jgi:hypothetical protein
MVGIRNAQLMPMWCFVPSHRLQTVTSKCSPLPKSTIPDSNPTDRRTSLLLDVVVLVVAALAAPAASAAAAAAAASARLRAPRIVSAMPIGWALTPELTACAVKASVANSGYCDSTPCTAATLQALALPTATTADEEDEGGDAVAAFGGTSGWCGDVQESVARVTWLLLDLAWAL